jgi:hypothetical protein
VTAFEKKSYTLECDGKGACPAVFRGQPREARAHVRKRAGEMFGWTHIRSDHGPYYDTDLCPAHKPEGS